jgi:hypothetical protein
MRLPIRAFNTTIQHLQYHNTFNTTTGGYAHESGISPWKSNEGANQDPKQSFFQSKDEAEGSEG